LVGGYHDLQAAAPHAEHPCKSSAGIPNQQKKAAKPTLKPAA
jgi:hypothetical protein